jgi:hypothetical protein
VLQQTTGHETAGAGANAQWLGASNRYVVYNDRQCVEGSTPDDLCAVVYDVVARRRAHVLPRPIFSVSPDGATATSVDFIRLQKVRKGEENDCNALGLASSIV